MDIRHLVNEIPDDGATAVGSNTGSSDTAAEPAVVQSTNVDPYDNFDAMKEAFDRFQVMPIVPRMISRLENLAHRVYNYADFALGAPDVPPVVEDEGWYPSMNFKVREQDSSNMLYIAETARKLVYQYQIMDDAQKPAVTYGIREAKGASTCPKFGEFPAEIRLKIWRAAAQPPYCAHFYTSLYVGEVWGNTEGADAVERVRCHNPSFGVMPDHGLWGACHDTREIMKMAYRRWADCMAYAAVPSPDRIGYLPANIPAAADRNDIRCAHNPDRTKTWLKTVSVDDMVSREVFDTTHYGFVQRQRRRPAWEMQVIHPFYTGATFVSYILQPIHKDEVQYRRMATFNRVCRGMQHHMRQPTLRYQNVFSHPTVDELSLLYQFKDDFLRL